MSNATYVSIWDDDVAAGRDWLKFNVEFSRSHNDALVGGNGRMIRKLGPGTTFAKQKHPTGRVDFVGHTWTLKREFLRYFLGAKVYTYATGEDIQLAAALQRHGIQSWNPIHSGEASLRNLGLFGVDKHSSWNTSQVPRQWLFCKLIQEGFQPLSCRNCNAATVANCVKAFSGL
jgi:hypothetical protein